MTPRKPGSRPVSVVDPLADAPKTPEQLAEESRRHAEAVKAGGRDVKPTLVAPSENAETILIHFLEDGLTFGGQTFYRGQEIEFEVDGPAHKDTRDRNGNSWLDLDKRGQMKKWGKIYFDFGPWPGNDWADEKAKETEQKRHRAAPVLDKRV